MYDPPSSHYSEIDVSEYDQDQLFRFVGKGGRKFYYMTRILGLDYLWYDKERKKIEIWGPYFVHENQQSAHLIRAEIDNFFEKNTPQSDEWVEL
ncbi:hypothetical protein [Dishui Lake phycodnavirus 2]|nr:hypothetical protein [Dishui Lake phycodnavirus 2]